MKITTSPFSASAEFDPLPTYTWSSTVPRPVAQGWQCPICHIVYSPTVSACHCAHHALTNIQTSTGTAVISGTAPTDGLPKGTGITYTAKANGGGPEL